MTVISDNNLRDILLAIRSLRDTSLVEERSFSDVDYVRPQKSLAYEKVLNLFSNSIYKSLFKCTKQEFIRGVSF